MEAKCNFCEKTINGRDKAQFFPEDDTYICRPCQRRHVKSLESVTKPLSEENVNSRASGYVV